MTHTPRRGLAGALALLVLAGAPVGAQPGGTGSSSDPPSPVRFQSPGREAGVHAWWHWLDGAITREGITKDLEALKAQGVVQATILNVGLFEGRDFGVPRVAFASPEWFSMFRWALAEADRLGLTLGVHNCDGWSSSGGPWITPELSMKQLVWTKTLVPRGGSLDVRLARPAAVEGFYREVAVVAYRTTQRPSAFRAALPRLQVNDAEEAAEKLVDGCPVSSVRIQRGDRLVLSAKEPVAFDRVALHVRRPFMWGEPSRFTTRFAMETSRDGRAWSALTELLVRGLNRTEVLDVPPARARFVRLVVRETSDTDAWIPLELGELELLGKAESAAHSPSIPFVAEKTGSVKAAREDDIYVAGAEGAPAVAPRDVVVLTDRLEADGRLRWDAPEGSWAILRFGYTSTGATNAPATREGRGLECDKMDPAAVEHHFRGFPERLITEAGAHAGKTLRFVLVDSWEAGFQNWTARFPAEFEKRRGYSLLPWLPALAGETVASTRESEAALFDFRLTIADLIRESYYERLAALLHERKLELHAEVIYGGGDYPPLDVLRSTRMVDLPMTEFWTSASRDSLLEYAPADAPVLNLPACAAAGYGKPLVGSEAYTGFAHYSESLADLKPFGDRAFTAGINRMILHSVVHQPTEEKPGMTLGQFASHFNRHNLYWPHASAWLAYQARIQSVLGEGAPVFDVLYYLGDQLPQYFVRNASTSLPDGYTVNAANAEILSERVAVVDGRLQLNGSGDAALLSLPPQPYLSLDTLRRLEALVRDGAQVYGPKPLHTLSMADAREATAFRALADRVWGDVDGRTVFSHAYGKGAVSWGRPIGEVLADLGVAPQLAASPAGERDFLFVRRRVGDSDVYFVVNQRDRVLARECSFRVGDRTPEIWDPETGAVTRPAAFRIEGTELRLPVRFGPRQALVFVFRPERPSHFVTSVARGGATLFPAATGAETSIPDLRFEGDGLAIVPVASGELTLGTSDGRTLSGRFEAPERLPVVGLRGTLELRGPGVGSRGPIEIADLRSLTEYEAKEVRYFSGEATYRLHFSVPDAGGGDALRLDIGDFESVAEVTLNGHALGGLWRPGTELDVTASLRRENELVVTVANVYRNRLIGDLAEFGELRNLRTSSPIEQFLAPDRPLKRAGLLGPIQVTRIRSQRVPGFVAGAGPSAGKRPPARSCESLATLRLPGTTISLAQAVSSGSFAPPAGKPIAGLPAFCRVAGVIRPSADSHIEFEVWMPSTGWNRKLQGVGNGGFAGAISYDGLGRAVARGYAAASTDTGHKAGGVDAGWALGHPEKIVDFGHRAIHEMTVKAKAVIEAFYGEAPRRSYFASCSNGGRQALMEAQRYPADYDGIISGAPAAAWTAFMAGFAWNTQAMADPSAHVPPAKLPAIERAVIAACDARDGVPDGVLALPASCGFDPRTILCKGADSPDCLTAPQAEALAKVYAGPRGRDGKPIARGFPPGAETGPGGWGPWITGDAPGRSLQAAFARQFGANMVFDRADWDPRTFDFDRDVEVVEERTAKVLNATDPDLETFRRRGGKLILFHGWNDAALGAEATIDYFDAVRARMGREATDSFVRLYMVPGLQHCFGGPGAHYCGGLTVPLGDGQHDLSAALERWVEEGIAPGTMIATRPSDESNPAAGASLARPLCPHPQAAVFEGTGSPEDPSAYACEEPVSPL